MGYNASTSRNVAALIGFGILVCLLAGCGVTAGSSVPTSTQIAATQTAATQTATAQTAIASATGGTAVSDQLAITLDKQQYGANDTITVTITNHLPSAIFVADHQTNCTIVTLQWLSTNTWTTIHNCRMMTVTRMIKLDAGSTHVIQLIPGGGQMARTPWAAGSYRAILVYGTGTAPTSASGATAASVTFTVS